MAKRNSRQQNSASKFPLTLHPTGQYCKKIRGKLHYFGTDKKAALREYLEQATFLHTDRRQDLHQQQDGLTVKDLCNLYLEHQHVGVEAGQITASHYIRGSALQSSSFDTFCRTRLSHRPHHHAGPAKLQEHAA